MESESRKSGNLTNVTNHDKHTVRKHNGHFVGCCKNNRRTQQRWNAYDRVICESTQQIAKIEMKIDLSTIDYEDWNFKNLLQNAHEPSSNCSSEKCCRNGVRKSDGHFSARKAIDFIAFGCQRNLSWEKITVHWISFRPFEFCSEINYQKKWQKEFCCCRNGFPKWSPCRMRTAPGVRMHNLMAIHFRENMIEALAQHAHDFFETISLQWAPQNFGTIK